MYDEEYGYSAEIEVNGRQQILIELNLIEALRQWLHTIHQIDPFSVDLQVELDEEEQKSRRTFKRSPAFLYVSHYTYRIKISENLVKFPYIESHLKERL
ncbi:hypothetical protein DS031_12470 [Bacillus taeanensis]|uniref:Uncharacterized protein n=1 Tax=Bacillus taeanensis TaxID=273032 RepID=A0A366XSS6_9BACI|nr:hypothetical protein DS031_12470 [Bacillus taeanensis]